MFTGLVEEIGGTCEKAETERYDLERDIYLLCPYPPYPEEDEEEYEDEKK